MAHYTLIDLAEANNILALYGHPAAMCLTPFGHGISNTNYLVEFLDPQQKPLVLKVSNDKSLEQLNQELQLLITLQQTGFPWVVCPLKTKTGSLSYHWKKYWGALFPYIPHHSQHVQRTPERCQHIGKALGQLHRLTAKLSPVEISHLRPIEQVSYLTTSLKDFEQHPNCPADFKLAIHHLTLKHATITLKPRPDLHCHHPQRLAWELLDHQISQGTKALLHGDLYWDNCLFNNSQLMAILDFEQGGWGAMLYDLGVCLSDCALTAQGGPLTACFKAFMESYFEENTLLNLNDIAPYIAGSIVIGLFSIARWRIQRFTLGQLDPKRKNSYQDLVQKAFHFLQTFDPEYSHA